MTLPALGYLVVLLEHAAYAAWLIRTRRVDLVVGPVRTPSAILAGLLLLNGFSLGCFFWPAPLFVCGSIFLHVILWFDETLKCRSALIRWLFAVNHVLFIVLLVTLIR